MKVYSLRMVSIVHWHVLIDWKLAKYIAERLGIFTPYNILTNAFKGCKYEK